MLKKLTALAMALLLGATALAEVYEGQTAALSTVAVVSDAAGTLASVETPVGARVESGDALLQLDGTPAFASQDGTVSLVTASEGDEVDGEVLQIAPLERYQIYCTVDKAYQSAEATLVHSGETVYVKCTADGSHRAVGVVTRIEGEEYRVLTLGGALYIGETVYLYRDADFTASQRVGKGTVVSSDTESYTASGTLTRLCVDAGDTVERGQLLYATGGGTVAAPVAGIVSAVSVQTGDAVARDQVVAEIVPDESICVEISLDENEAAHIAVGSAARIHFADDAEDVTWPGVVVGVSALAESGMYTAIIQPQAQRPLSLGMSAEVRL